jgi:hypothetical protein
MQGVDREQRDGSETDLRSGSLLCVEGWTRLGATPADNETKEMFDDD